MSRTDVKADYGNWVSRRIIYFPTMLGLMLLPAAAVSYWFLTIPSIICFAFSAYFVYARHLFSPRGKDIQNKVWNLVLTNLDWNGNGKILDVGCGNGALTIKTAKHYPNAKVVGIDYWGTQWEYSKSDCEANARTEGVSDRVQFQKASASNLPFEDGYFDAAVSNMCFHEVADAKDKREVIREALRVVRKGGSFCFQDLFLLKKLYGSPEELVAAIKSWGVAEVEFVKTNKAPFIPSALKLPFMLGRVAIVIGKK